MALHYTQVEDYETWVHTLLTAYFQGGFSIHQIICEQQCAEK